MAASQSIMNLFSSDEAALDQPGNELVRLRGVETIDLAKSLSGQRLWLILQGIDRQQHRDLLQAGGGGFLGKGVFYDLLHEMPYESVVRLHPS